MKLVFLWDLYLIRFSIIVSTSWKLPFSWVDKKWQFPGWQTLTEDWYVQTIQNMDNITNKEELLECLSDVFRKTKTKGIPVKEDDVELWLVHDFLIFPEFFLMIPECTIN